MCSCRGPSACKQGRRIYNTLLLQAMALYIHGPLRCKNLLGRIPNPHSRHALAVPQHAPGPRSDARSQRAPPGEIVHRLAAPDPAATPAGERPAPPARPRSDRPAASRTHAAHTHTAQIRHPAAHAGSCAALAASPQTARKPARLASRTGFFFCMMEPDTAWRQRSGKMQLLFQSLLQHPGEVDPLRHCGIIQPRRNRKGFLNRLFKMLLGILCHIH